MQQNKDKRLEAVEEKFVRVHVEIMNQIQGVWLLEEFVEMNFPPLIAGWERVEHLMEEMRDFLHEHHG